MARRRSDNSLEAVAERFSEWRRRRVRGERIPEALWAAAVASAQTTGISQVSSTLNLDYYSLKKRCDKVADAPQFLELPAVPSVAATSECLVELEDASGAKMRIHVKGESVDIESLASGFWRDE